MSQKYEREIDEILQHMDDRPPREATETRQQREIGDLGSRRQGGFEWRWTPSQLLLIGIGLALMGYLIRFGSPLLALAAGILSVVLLIAALVTSVAGSRAGRSKTVWRGRKLEYSIYDDHVQPSWISRLLSRPNSRRPPPTR